MCNDKGEVITFCLTGANVDDRNERVWSLFAKEFFNTSKPPFTKKTGIFLSVADCTNGFLWKRNAMQGISWKKVRLLLRDGHFRIYEIEINIWNLKKRCFYFAYYTAESLKRKV